MRGELSVDHWAQLLVEPQTAATGSAVEINPRFICILRIFQ